METRGNRKAGDRTRQGGKEAAPRDLREGLRLPLVAMVPSTAEAANQAIRAQAGPILC